jgi:hypothetical protein
MIGPKKIEDVAGVARALDFELACRDGEVAVLTQYARLRECERGVIA